MKYIAHETLMMAGRLIAAGQAIDLDPEHAEILGDLVSPAQEGKGKKQGRPETNAEPETATTTSNETHKEGDQP